MIRNYIKVALRNLRKNKAFSLTNLLGLTIGITCTLLIMLWVQNELSWDRFQKNYSSIKQVYANRNFNGEIVTDASIMLPLADAMERQIPQVKYAAFTSYAEDHILTVDDKMIKKSGYRVSKNYFNIFSCKFIKGDAASALASPDGIILSASCARSFFGTEDVMNKALKMDNGLDVKVSAVVEDAPSASSMHFDFITPYNYNDKAMLNWENSYTNVYVLTKPATDALTLEKNLNKLTRERSPDNSSSYFLHPMSKWRLYSDFQNGKNTGGMIAYVKLFTIVALVILLIACINFMNLSTARSEKRAKEVGIRKTLGSNKKQLIFQFFSESFILAFTAFLLSIVAVWLLLPAFNSLVDKQLVLHVMDKEFWLIAAGVILITGLFAGSYPAFYLSSFNPVKVLKGSFLPGKAATLPRKVLVVCQFAISILFIASTIIVYRQIQHVKNRDLGYRADNLIMIPSSPDANRNYSAIKQELLSSGLVSSTTRTSAPITDIWNFTPAPDYEGKPTGANMIFSAIGATEDFAKTIGIQMIEGRDFEGTPADSSSLLLNESAVKTMGLKHPVGMEMMYMNRKYTVKGITANVVMSSPYKPVDPMMILYRPRNPSFINIRLNKDVQPQKALLAIGDVFKKYNPAFPFEYQFADQEFGKKFLTEELIGKLSRLFAGLAIFICCLGLSGLAAFTIQKRFREIGIRKVLGASTKQLLYTLSREFVYLVIIALVIAIPVTWWLMSNWLQSYEYRVSIDVWQFLIAGAGVMLLTLITVCLNAMKAAVSKPVKSLRMD
jgi:ABC-type antimicrobial peptide transport system permease subunit